MHLCGGEDAVSMGIHGEASTYNALRGALLYGGAVDEPRVKIGG
jgi:hypothetical protein